MNKFDLFFLANKAFLLALVFTGLGILWGWMIDKPGICWLFAGLGMTCGVIWYEWKNMD